MTDAVKNAVRGFAVTVVTALGLGEAAASFVYVFIISMLPIIELRGAIPVAYALGLDALPAFFISIIGNLLPIPFILWLLVPVCNLLKKTRLLRWFPEWMERKVEKNREKVEKYAFWGLVLFVAIPLPGTGAWTGAAVASFLDYKFRDAMLAIILGVLIAGCIMTALSYGLFDAVASLF